MRKLVIIAVTVVMAVTMGMGSAFAARQQMGDKELDASLIIGTAPASGFGTGFGINVGAGMMLPQIDPNLQGRVDLSYISWSASEFGTTVTYNRMPLAVSGRYYLPTAQRGLKVYVQGGLELSFDTAEAAVTNPFTGQTYTASASDTNLGITPGAGIEIALQNNLSFVADARLHMITDSYFTLQGGIAYHF